MTQSTNRRVSCYATGSFVSISLDLILRYEKDQLGSVNELVSSTGSVVSQYTYDAYGNKTTVSGTVVSDIGYAGYFYHAVSGLDFTMFRAYDPTHARWLNRDPIGELGGINLYAYTNGNPATLADPLGLWSPGAHDEIIRDSFARVLTPADIGVLQKASRDFDSSHQSAADSYMHAMRESGQSAADAIQLTNNFIADRISAARQYAQAGNRQCALEALGQAMHPVMDASSPMHRTPDGQPKVWNPWWPFGHSPNDEIGNETIYDLTSAILRQQHDALNDLYNQVFNR
jgi:RHS repeat-associated protein